MDWKLGGLIALVFVAGCDNARHAKEAVRNQMKDPDSAVFKDVETSKGGGVACGLVNGKNGFGAMVGFQPFIYFNQSAILANDEDEAPQLVECCALLIDAANNKKPSSEYPDYAAKCPGFKGFSWGDA